jgi:hypothetical protein
MMEFGGEEEICTSITSPHANGVPESPKNPRDLAFPVMVGLTKAALMKGAKVAKTARVVVNCILVVFWVGFELGLLRKL